MAAVAAAREGRTVLLLERTAHIGGLPANGLGATDIHTRGATGGMFLEFVERIRSHYARVYGPDSPQLALASDGYHFEPSVAEAVLGAMLAEQPRIAVRTLRQFDALPERVEMHAERIAAIHVLDRQTGALERCAGAVFIDATYEGDLAAAAGAPYAIGREGADAYAEPLAGVVYKYWGGPVGPWSTFAGDNAIQAYNYRLCLTRDPARRVPIARPERYDPAEYRSLVEDVRTGRHTGAEMAALTPEAWQALQQRRAAGAPAPVPGEPFGIRRLVNMIPLPNGKTDANNQHLAFLSTDLPEENWPWPSASWDWRDRFAERQRDYTLGLLWFAQNDPALPDSFRQACREWGLARDEYADNGHFPRQVYVREGRRIRGVYLFTAHDALPTAPGRRPPVHGGSITASHYAIDSHAVRKREEGRVHLDGFLSYRNTPYTVPYGVITPIRVDNLLVPVAASSTHLGFSTLRMEPCWMALGQAAGLAAGLAIGSGAPVQAVPVAALQERLLAQGAVLMYFEDAGPAHPAWAALQFFALRGFFPEWQARLDEAIAPEDAARFQAWAGLAPEGVPAGQSRGAFLQRLQARVQQLPPERAADIRAPEDAPPPPHRH